LAGSHENAPISQGDIINQKNIEIDSLRKDLTKMQLKQWRLTDYKGRVIN
jgi:hypothetical protein